ncbi:SDR family NAD(P)-dependent oxidoreductase [Dactylosporangium sp. CA-139066]|uniref:SDR family NAD(P)-dependent oxidoreductase n=1 Tax=Dactylosporangium sp. CA-139066 TaxID=3239930 RepID=UPI003D8A3F38
MSGTERSGGGGASRTLLVTGASTGIGLEVAKAAAAAGWTVAAGMRKPYDVPGVDVRELDVTDPDSVAACVAGVVADHGRLDALVNNAGVGNTVPTIELADLAAFRANIEVNFFGVVAMTKAALPHLRAAGGRLVTVGSTRGLVGQPFNEAYCAAKFAVEGFLEALAPVAAGMGVRVVIVEPGPVLGTAFAANTGVTRDSLLAGAGPYEPVLRPYLDWVARTAWPGAQPAEEVAGIVLRALTEPDPPPRVLTSDWAREFAGVKLADADGTAVRRLAREWLTG